MRQQDTQTRCLCLAAEVSGNRDLDLDPMTLTHKLDLKIPKMHLRIENELFGQNAHQKVEHYCRQTRRQI